MNEFIIFTKEYGKELESYLSPIVEMKTMEDCHGHYFDLLKQDFNQGQLVSAMENIIISKNPVLIHSSSLRKRIKEMVFAKKREDLVRDLDSFMQENTEMNLEGYLRFRFNDFSSTINVILYSIIKKSMRCLMWI